jgi:hypothetical protein
MNLLKVGTASTLNLLLPPYGRGAGQFSADLY